VYFNQQMLREAINLGLLPLTASSIMSLAQVLAEIISVIEFKEGEVERLSNSIRSDADALRMSEDIPQAAGAYYLILQNMVEKQEQVALLRGHICVLWATIPWHRRIGIGLARILSLFRSNEGES
jgi:hypothetical protein